MPSPHVPALLAKYPIISDQIQRPALEVVLNGLDDVLTRGPQGDITEFGCYVGTTSLFIRRLIDAHGQSDVRQFHVYDSFEGLPTKSSHDASAAGTEFVAGELSVSKKQFLDQFRRANLQPPVTHKKWFSDLMPEEVPDTIAYAFLDGDFYQSIIDSLRLVWPRMAAGGIITVDDYKREKLPGVERALRDFLQDKPHRLTYAHNIAVIHIL